eukprot:TRINITY_DN18611_c0_g1_i1.p1 TRINITY_DN18611_c0_g1~~TRINITY_DN18611_c0_g1_i1.p1  ORF type:complete len:324 (+),score=104.82 TRINITY_DN18611_c0_g1_i1:57-1028(+)
MLTLSRRRLVAAAAAARSAAHAGAGGGNASYTSWAVTVETPLYQARERDGSTVFMCRSTAKVFDTAAEFVAFAARAPRGEKAEEDLVFEDAAKQAARAERPAAPAAAARAPPAEDGQVYETIRSGGLELVLVTTPEGGEQVRLRTGEHELVGIMPIRQWIQQGGAQHDDKAARSLINLVKIYIPVQSRPGYTLKKAFAVIRRKASTTVSLQSTIQPTLVPHVPNASPYITGSAAERETLFHVTANDPSATIPMYQRPLHPKGREFVDVNACAVIGTVDAPFVQTPAGQMTLTEFASCTSYAKYDRSPLVTSVREFLAHRWNEP